MLEARRDRVQAPPKLRSTVPNCSKGALGRKSSEGPMKSQRILALIAGTLALGAGGVANAQGAPVYVGPGAPPPFEPPRYVRVEPLPDDVLLPQEIVGILRSTGFSPRSVPIRRGRFYVVAALHPDGEDGQVTMDAVTGRFIRFVPADLVGRSMASYPPPFAATRRGVLRPPMPLPGVAVRTPTPAARPPAASQANAQTTNAAATGQPAQMPADKPAETRTANASANATAKADPVEIKPSFSKPAGGPVLLPIKPMPPAQGFE
jgi:hypothetical protein